MRNDDPEQQQKHNSKQQSQISGSRHLGSSIHMNGIDSFADLCNELERIAFG